MDYTSKIVKVPDTIKNVVLGELRSIIFDCKGNNYMKFTMIAIGIEFLGACLDDFPFNKAEILKPELKVKISQSRFDNALKKLFDKKYLKHAKESANVYLYRDFRCGFVHQLRPLGNLVVTHREESIREGTKHLQNINKGPLVLVLEDLFEDFECASNKLLRDFDKKITNKKSDMKYLTYTNIQNNTPLTKK